MATDSTLYVLNYNGVYIKWLPDRRTYLRILAQKKSKITWIYAWTMNQSLYQMKIRLSTDMSLGISCMRTSNAFFAESYEKQMKRFHGLGKSKEASKVTDHNALHCCTEES